MSEVLSFVIYHDGLDERLDVRYYHPKYFKILEKLKNSKFKIRKFGDISQSIKDGPGGWDIHVSDYVEKGIPMLRILNLSEEGLKISDLVYISEEKHKELKRSEVNPKDILLSMRGTIGLATVAPEEIKTANINAAICRIRLKEDLNPFYVSAFLNSKFGRLQTERGGFKAVQHDLNLSIIKSIKIPIPPRPIQDRIAELMEEAYKQRKEKLKEAEDLLAGINDFVLDKLGIEIPEVEEKKSFGVMLKELKEGKRQDVFYYQPKYTAALSALEKSEWETKPLKDIAEKSSETRDPTKTPEKPFVYVEISDVDTKLGEITLYKELNGKEAPSRARMVIRKGDIVVSTTRPYRGAIAIVPDRLDDSIGSTGFAVFRLKEEINSLYLQTILRSKLCLAQLEQRMTGSNYPAITTGELKKIKIPVPPIEIQKEIAGEVKRRRERAKVLRKEAEEVVKRAKGKVERMILGEETEKLIL